MESQDCAVSKLGITVSAAPRDGCSQRSLVRVASGADTDNEHGRWKQTRNFWKVRSAGKQMNQGTVTERAWGKGVLFL